MSAKQKPVRETYWLFHKGIIMRHHILCISFALALYGCNNQSNEQAKAPNLLLPKQQPVVIVKDTVSAIEQNILLGNVLFGMSKKVATLNIKQFEKDSNWRIGSFEFESAFDDYRQDSLYRLTLQGKAREVDEYSSGLHDEIALLYQTINAKYGNPSVDNGFPPINAVRVYSSHRCFGWNIGKKVIEIRVANMKLYYHALLVIYNREITQELEAEKVKEKP